MACERISIKEALLCASAGLPIPSGRSIVGVVAKVVASEHTTARAVVYVKDDSGTVPVEYDTGPTGAVRVGQAIKCGKLCPRERAKRATVKYPLELVALSVVASTTPTAATMHQKTVEDVARSVRSFGALGNTPEGQVAFENLLGLVVKVFARRTVTTKASRVVPKQSVLLTDGDNTVICTFWGSNTDITDSFVEKSTSLLCLPHHHPPHTLEKLPTLLCQQAALLLDSAAVSVFRGRPNATVAMDTILTIDPKVEAVTVLMARQLQHEKLCLALSPCLCNESAPFMLMVCAQGVCSHARSKMYTRRAACLMRAASSRATTLCTAR